MNMEISKESVESLPPDTVAFVMSDERTEVLRITRDGIRANPEVPVDDAARAVLAALDACVRVLVQRAVEAEREACIGICDAIAEQHRRSHYPDLESVADECSGQIRARVEL